MAYKNPTTQIVLIKGCPLDRNYNNTFYFHNKVVQENFFTKNYLNGGSIYTKSFYSAYSYQRYDEGEIFIEGRYDRMIGHNYICFKNFKDGKWYYGFIDDMEYINENTTRVSYTIDVMQTWYFDYTMTTTFVEREHTETDVVGEHLVNEGFDVGEMVSLREASFTPNNNLLVIAYLPNYDTFLDSFESTEFIIGIDGGTKKQTGLPDNIYDTIDNIPLGTLFYFIHTDYPNVSKNFRNAVEGITKIKGTIVSIFVVPENSVNIRGYSIDEPSLAPVDYGSGWAGTISKYWKIESFNTQTFDVSQPLAFFDISGSYIPRNKKLYTSPFSSLVITNNDGTNNTYYWEESNFRQENGRKKVKFNIDFIWFNKPLMNIYPLGYRGLTKDFENSVPIQRFIEPSWSVDSYNKWSSENNNAIGFTIIKSALMGLVSGGSGAVLSTAMAATSYIESGIKAKNTPDSYQKGNYMPLYNQINDKFGYTAYCMGCHIDIAKTIDDHFTMFGYAIKKLKIPNIKNYEAKLRPHWNFVKTAGCHIMPAWETADDVITGTRNSIPKEAEELINSIYDKGVTFWMHNGGELGDYTLDNSPTV